MNDQSKLPANDSYERLGASSSKSGVLAAVGAGKTAHYFCDPIPDPFGDPGKAFFLHADGAGTKSIVAYLMAKESGSNKFFGSLAIDSLVMNLDDLACVGAIDGLVLCNTIGRNFHRVGDDAVKEIVAGYSACAKTLEQLGVSVAIGGGETADLGDIVRTLVVDSTMTARVPYSELLDTRNVVVGDIIVGFSSTGKASFETAENSGMGSNGLTLARHALLNSSYAKRYPEVCEPSLDAKDAYRGSFNLSDTLDGTSLSVGEALLSPTRSYAPLIKRLRSQLRSDLHGAIHCTGGGQAKVKRFGHGVRFIKDNLFATPPLFAAIQASGQVPWKDMYTVFNMGHRVEIMIPQERFESAVKEAAAFGIEARQIGKVTKLEGNSIVVIDSPYGCFEYF